VRSNSGDILDQMDVVIEWNGVYVLNVLRAESYTRGTVYYGDGPRSAGDKVPQLIKDRWIAATKIDYLFQDPPKTISIQRSKGPTGPDFTSRSYLWRQEPLQQEP
jgi:hypothetical protein